MSINAESLDRTVSIHLTAAQHTLAETLSKREGVDLDQFLEHMLSDVLEIKERLASREPLAPERLREALAILDRCGDNDPLPGDELPPGYERMKY